MPCDSVRQVSVDLGKVNLEIMAKALEAEGIRTQIQVGRNGKFLVFQGQWIREDGQSRLDETTEVNYLKRAYSNQIVRIQAKRFGWGVQEKPNGQLLVVKRTI